MSKPTGFTSLAKELTRDPRLKQAVARARRKTPGKSVRQIDNATGVVLLLLGIASRFSKKKRARALHEAMDVIHLLVQVSIVLKENIFDRPQVRKFFSQSYRQVYLLARDLVAVVLPKTGEAARSRRRLRSA